MAAPEGAIEKGGKSSPSKGTYFDILKARLGADKANNS